MPKPTSKLFVTMKATSIVLPKATSLYGLWALKDVSVMVFQNSYHKFYITPKFSISQKYHHSFLMFIATFIQDLCQTRIYSPGIYFDEWWQDTWWHTWQIISLEWGNVNIGKLSIFNLLFSSTQPQL